MQKIITKRVLNGQQKTRRGEIQGVLLDAQTEPVLSVAPDTEVAQFVAAAGRLVRVAQAQPRTDLDGENSSVTAEATDPAFESSATPVSTGQSVGAAALADSDTDTRDSAVGSEPFDTVTELDALVQQSPTAAGASSASWLNPVLLAQGLLGAGAAVAAGRGKDSVLPGDTQAPVFSSAKTVAIAENSPANTVVYSVSATDNVKVVRFALVDGGADNALFTLDEDIGKLFFRQSMDFENPQSAAGNNQYHVKIAVYDKAGNASVQDLTVTVNNVAESMQSSAQLFELWQTAETGGDINALNKYSADILAHRDATTANGLGNGSRALSQWVDQVQGTDVVSKAGYTAGFKITGHAAAGAQDTIRFYLDNDRTDGRPEIGSLLTNGSDGVHISYDNASGDYSIVFDAESSALKSATHGVYGSGVHQITVDTDGGGKKNGAEASRLFLVASGTALVGDDGSAAVNYSVIDRYTGDVFVYYYGDPDGRGVGLLTELDAGDKSDDPRVIKTDRDDIPALLPADLDYYSRAGLGGAPGAAVGTADNTALHFVTNIDPQVWAVHFSRKEGFESYWDAANTSAADHSQWGSNTSRLPSLSEVMALYAANFGQNESGSDWSHGSQTPGAVQAFADEMLINGRRGPASEDNVPSGWDLAYWTAAPTPSGHAYVDLRTGTIYDQVDTSTLLILAAM